MIDPHQFMAAAIDAVRVNRVWRVEQVNGSPRPAWIKLRRWPADPVIVAGNVFLYASNSRIRMFASCERWRRHELSSFRLVHGGEYQCGEHGPRAIWTDAIPGMSLRDMYLKSESREMIEKAISACGVELARAHRLSFTTGHAWSHGDPHPANFLFDAATGRARLIDFETAHEPQLEMVDRHADDALTFLLEVLGRSADADWPRHGMRFIDAYGRGPVIDRLATRLRYPRGFEAVLWSTRTADAPKNIVVSRLSQLPAAMLTTASVAAQPSSANRTGR